MRWSYTQVYALTRPGGPENWIIQSPDTLKNRPLMATLRELGEQGWEVVAMAIIENRSGDTLGGHYFLKQQLPDA